ncbi:MAG: hypothetical protein HF312_15680 [Ignavibacteria bacterium]|nr:hypothetical protein [Ignavibacteria bacterium]
MKTTRVRQEMRRSIAVEIEIGRVNERFGFYLTMMAFACLMVYVAGNMRLMIIPVIGAVVNTIFWLIARHLVESQRA